MARCQCGESSPDDARFCASCGSVLGEQTGLLGVSNAGSSATGAGVTTVATTGGIDRRFLGVAGVLLAATIGWAAWSGAPGVESAEPSNGSEVDRETPTSPPTTSPPSTTPTTASPSSTATPTTLGEGPTRGQVGDGSPLLGEPTGLRLVVGHNVNRPTVLDLDTGELALGPRASGGLHVLAISGDRLVAQATDRLVSVPVLDVGAEPVVLLPESGGQVGLPPQSPRRDGRVWVVEHDEAGRTLQLVDLETGSSLTEGPSIAYDEPVWELTPPTSSGDPALLGHLSGGVYEAGAEGYRRVAAGRLMAADDTRVLVETCDDHLRCGPSWFGRTTGEPLDLAVPKGRGDQIAFVGGTDWISVVDYAGDGVGSTLLNVETGARYEIDAPFIDPMVYGNVGPVISPDGRWLALYHGVDITIVDLASGTEHSIEGVGSAPAALMLTDAEIGYSFN